MLFGSLGEYELIMAPRLYHRDPDAHGRKATVGMWVMIVAIILWTVAFYESLLTGGIGEWIGYGLMLLALAMMIAMAKFDVVFH